MTVELALAIVVASAFCCYLVWQWQGAAIPPYQAPLKSVECNQDCRQGRDCDCFQRSCDMTVEEFDGKLDTKLNPQAAWPFPTGSKP
jgi:hypothetical protein